MGSLRKILLLSFFGLLVIVIIQVVLLLVSYVRPSNNSTSSDNLPNNQTTSQDRLRSAGLTGDAVNRSALSYLRVMPRGALTSLTAHAKYSGTVNAIWYDPVTSTLGDRYQKGMKIVNDDGKFTEMLITDADLDVLRVYQGQGTSRKEINFNDLKVGNRVEAERIMDIAKPSGSNSINISIYKL